MPRRAAPGGLPGGGSAGSRTGARLPCVLLVEPDAERRKKLGLVLSADGWEVVPAADAAEGARLAGTLAPQVLVAPAALASRERRLAAELGTGSRLLLGDRAGPIEAEPGGRALLPTGGLRDSEVAQRLRRLLLGLALDLAPDLDVGTLSGELRKRSMLELLRALARHGADARVEIAEGAIEIRAGEVVAARTGEASGVKAFCRLARATEGRVRIAFVEGRLPQREIHDDIDSLIATAIEDALGERPPSGTRFRVELGRGFFDRGYSVLEREILEAAHRGTSIDEIVDSSPLPDGEIVREVLALERRGALARREPPKPPVIVTVLGADLPTVLAASHGIEMVAPPPAAAAAAKRAPDAAEVDPGPFYRVTEALAGEAQGDLVGLWAARFEQLLAQRAVLALLPPVSLSGALVHARRAAHRLSSGARDADAAGRSELTILDTGQAGLGLGMLALFAARLARRGRDGARIGRRIAGIAERMRTLLFVDRAEFLARRRRVGKVRARAARLLGPKPILGLQEGRLVTVSWTLGRRAGVGRLVELAASRLPADRPSIVGIAHAKAPRAAAELRRLVDERLAVVEWISGEIGPALQEHAGPGAVGLSIFQPTVEEAPLVAPLEPGAGSARIGP